jgi:D-serine deaminase-like pyridoxal phosphate-dependent protein
MGDGDREGYDGAAVSALSVLPVPPGSKGFAVPPGPGVAAVTGAGLAGAGATLFGGALSFPLLALRDTAVAHNISQLARFTAANGVGLAPHAKTTMAPQLFARQLAAGAWGLTAATIEQVMVYRQFGVRRVLLANELLDPAAIGWLAAELRADPEFEFCCYVDSLGGVELLDQVLAGIPGWTETGRRLDVLVELGYPGGRTGCRTQAQARAVAAAAAGTPVLAVAGVAGYEGGLGHHRTAEVLAAVEAWCRQLLELLREFGSAGVLAGSGLVTAGGSAFPDVVARVFAERPAGVTALLRSGSYITHDHGLYAELSPFTAAAGSDYALRPALELWARVLSRPEPGLAVLALGRRDVGFDSGLPIPDGVRTGHGETRPGRDLRVSQLNDQHAYLEVPAEHPLKPGDLVRLGISHPCTTLDRWRHLVLLDDDDRVLDVITTFF